MLLQSLLRQTYIKKGSVKGRSMRKNNILISTISIVILTAVLFSACGSTSENATTPVAYTVIDPACLPDEAEISTMPLGIYMYAWNYDEAENVLTVLIVNESGYEMTYGNEYCLQEKVDGEWVDVETSGEIAWTEDAHIIEDLEQVEVDYDLSPYGRLETGVDYRLVKTDLTAEFRLIQEWTE